AGTALRRAAAGGADLAAADDQRLHRAAQGQLADLGGHAHRAHQDLLDARQRHARPPRPRRGGVCVVSRRRPAVRVPGAAARAPVRGGASGGGAMMRVDSLTKTHPGADAPTLRGLSLDAPAGALVAILGRSGAGKATFLRCACGLDGFDAGSIEVDGPRIEGGADPAPLLGKVGMVFQSLELFPHLRVIDNLLLAPLRARRSNSATANARPRDLLRDLELGDKERVFPASLSGGQRQRVAIAPALMVEPKVLLYDEPTRAL